MCELILFGAPELVCDGRARRITRRKARAVLAYLAVTQQRQTRETLAALFWPEYEESEGRADLSRILSALRKVLGASVFQADRDGVALAPDAGLRVDVVRFRRLVDDCRRQQRGDVAQDCRSQLAQAADLYRNDFLAGFTLPGCPAFDDWQRMEAQSLRRDLDWVLARLASAHAAAGERAQAITYTRRRVALDPLHEAAQRALISLLVRDGQLAEARRQYEACAQLLREELGVEPHPDTERLYEQVRYARESKGPLPAYLVEAVRAHGEPARFVGRGAQLAHLDRHLAAAMEGDGRPVFVTGGAGRGKTSLLRAFARRAMERHPHLVVAGGSGNTIAGAGDPYLPFRQTLATLGGGAGQLFDKEQARRLWALLPQTARAITEYGPQLLDTFVPAKQLLSRAESAAPAGEPWLDALREEVARVQRQGDLQQTALFSQFSDVLQALARQQPLLLLLDDLQWFDEASIALLFHFGRRLAGSRILLAGAYRPADLAQPDSGQGLALGRVLNELRRTYGDIVLDLAQADQNEGRAFVDAYLDGEPNRLDEAFRRALYEQTAGHPLFTVELLRDMQRRGDLYRDEEGRWRAGQDLNWQRLPARVEAVIAQRIAPLDDVSRQVLSVAAVEGEQFTAECVARVLGMDMGDLLRVLSDRLGRQHGLVRAHGEAVAGGRSLALYNFGHALFRQYVYRQLDLGQQRRLHGAVAEALMALYSGDEAPVVVQLAHHHRAAGQWEEASRYLMQAGDVARRRAALPEAARHYEAALARWPAADQAGRAQLLRKLGECYWMLARHAEALDTLQVGLELFREMDDKEGAGETLVTLGRVYWEQGRAREAQQAFQRALAILQDEPQRTAQVWALAGMAGYHMHLCDYDRAIQLGERALAQARRMGDEALIIHCLCDLGSARSGKGDWEGLELERESLARALQGNRPHDAGRAYLYLAEGLGYEGRYDEARGLLEEALAYAQRAHLPYIGAGAERQLADIDWLLGRWSDALGRLDLAEEKASSWSGHYRNLTLARIYNDLGRPQKALALAQEALAGAGEALDPRLALLGELARAEVQLGESAAAVAAMREALEAADQARYLFANANMALLTICRAPPAYDMPAAAGEARAALRQLQRLDRQYGTQNTAACLQEGQGWLALFDGETDQAAQSLAEAAELWQALGHHYDEARALQGLSRALRQSGDHDDAIDACRQALGLVNALAEQLDEQSLQAAFLDSALVRELRAGC